MIRQLQCMCSSGRKKFAQPAVLLGSVTVLMLPVMCTTTAFVRSLRYGPVLSSNPPSHSSTLRRVVLSLGLDWFDPGVCLPRSVPRKPHQP